MVDELSSLGHPLPAIRQPLRRTSDSVFSNFPGDGVAVQAQHLGRVPEIAFGALKGTRDEHLLELAPGVVVEDALVEHFRNELLQLIAHGL